VIDLIDDEALAKGAAEKKKKKAIEELWGVKSG